MMLRSIGLGTGLLLTLLSINAVAQGDSAPAETPAERQVGAADESGRLIQFTIRYISIPATLRQNPEFRRLADIDEASTSPVLNRNRMAMTDAYWLSTDDSERLIKIVESDSSLKSVGPAKMVILAGRTARLIASDGPPTATSGKPVKTVSKSETEDPSLIPISLTMTAAPEPSGMLACKFDLEQVHNPSPRATEDKSTTQRIRLKTTCAPGQTFLIRGWNENHLNKISEDTLLLATVEFVNAPPMQDFSE